MRRALFLFLTALLALPLLFTLSPLDAGEGPQRPQRAGEVRSLVPVGHIVRGAAPQIEAKRNDPVFWQDVVRTQKGGRARIGLLDGSILNVGSESQLQIVQHDAATQSTAIDLAYGRLRSKAVRLSRPSAQFEVRTPVAHAGVVGTLFITRVFPSYTEILCLEGSVRARSRDTSVAGEVLVRAGEFTRVARGLPPTPPAPAPPELLREAQEETDLPLALELSRVELSWPPAGCGVDAELLLRGWGKQLRDGKEIETPVDGEMLTGTLQAGALSVFVEGGRASLQGPFSAEPPQGAFTPSGAAAPVPTKIYEPLKLAAGESWRAPRAVFVGAAFYVLGPMGFKGPAEFRFAQSPATLLWQGPCGAGFLAPPIPAGEYDVTMLLSGNPAARGRMNLIDVSYRMAVPPVITRGKETDFGVDLRGLAGLEQHTGGRPILTVALTNQTPAIIGNLRSSTRGSKVSGETVTFVVGGGNIDAAGMARLDASARGRQAGNFNLGVKIELDDALEKPRTPLAPVPASP
jgi:hypothetical protein